VQTIAFGDFMYCINGKDKNEFPIMRRDLDKMAYDISQMIQKVNVLNKFSYSLENFVQAIKLLK
jgi:methyl-accepting chemotaxis protein